MLRGKNGTVEAAFDPRAVCLDLAHRVKLVAYPLQSSSETRTRKIFLLRLIKPDYCRNELNS